jgi:hypothetical protein
MDFEDWHSDFGAFYRAVEWMGLQRHLKVAGIFARLTLRDGKPKYLADTPRFIAYIRERMWQQGQALGFVPAERPGVLARGWAMAWGAALFVRSQFARSTSTLEHTYLGELGVADADTVLVNGSGLSREVRLKLEKAGLKTYTQVADSKEGKRTRVRVGPFANKAEADQAALKIKALDLPATILSL